MSKLTLIYSICSIKHKLPNTDVDIINSELNIPLFRSISVLYNKNNISSYKYILAFDSNSWLNSLY